MSVPNSARSVRTIRTAASFSSWLYRRVCGFPGVCSFGMTPSSFPRSGASKKPSAVHPPICVGRSAPTRGRAHCVCRAMRAHRGISGGAATPKRGAMMSKKGGADLRYEVTRAHHVLQTVNGRTLPRLESRSSCEPLLEELENGGPFPRVTASSGERFTSGQRLPSSSCCVRLSGVSRFLSEFPSRMCDFNVGPSFRPGKPALVHGNMRPFGLELNGATAFELTGVGACLIR